MRHLLGSAAERLTTVAAAPAASAPAGVHTDTFLILAAVLCFLLCVVGLALVARCSRLCNPSAYSVDAGGEAAAMPASCKGIEEAALRKLPTVAFEAENEAAGQEECAICLAEFVRGDEVRVLPPCGHAFHAACVDTWLLCTSTCPSCRSALVVVPAVAASDTPQCCASAQASTPPEFAVAVVVVERGPCRTSVP